MTALVGQNPDTGTVQTLDDGIEPPQQNTRRVRGNGLGSDIVVEDIKDRGKDRDISEDIVQAGHGGAIETVGGNGIADVLDRVIGNLELIAIGIQHLAIVHLLGVRCH